MHLKIERKKNVRHVLNKEREKEIKREILKKNSFNLEKFILNNKNKKKKFFVTALLFIVIFYLDEREREKINIFLKEDNFSIFLIYLIFFFSSLV